MNNALLRKIYEVCKQILPEHFLARKFVKVFACSLLHFLCVEKIPNYIDKIMYRRGRLLEGYKFKFYLIAHIIDLVALLSLCKIRQKLNL